VAKNRAAGRKLAELDLELAFQRDLATRSAHALEEFERDRKAGVDRAVATLLWLVSEIPAASALGPPLNYLVDALAGLDVGKAAVLFKPAHISNAPGLSYSEMKRRAILTLCVEWYRAQGMTLLAACKTVATGAGEKAQAIKKWRDGVLSPSNKTYRPASNFRFSAGTFFDEIRAEYRAVLESPDAPSRLLAAAMALSEHPKKPPS
jgi:hypothetical protein